MRETQKGHRRSRKGHHRGEETAGTVGTHHGSVALLSLHSQMPQSWGLGTQAGNTQYPLCSLNSSSLGWAGLRL